MSRRNPLDTKKELLLSRSYGMKNRVVAYRRTITSLEMNLEAVNAVLHLDEATLRSTIFGINSVDKEKNADRFGQEKKKLTDRKEFYEKRLQVYNDSVCRLEANIEAIDKVYNLPEISLVAAIFGHQKNGKEVHPPDGEPLEAVAAAEMPAPSYDVCSALTSDAPLGSIDPKDANGKQCTADTGSF